MRKLFFAFAAGLLLLAGCAKEYDDTALKEKVDALDKKVTALQTEVDKLKGDVSGLTTTINEWKNGGLITKIEDAKEGGVVVGKTITFLGGKTVTLFYGKDGAQGQPGASPVIGVKEDAGVLYWTVNGEYIISGGKMVPVNVVPSFELKEGHLWVTINGVAQDLGSISGGAAVDALIKSIEETETTVVITLNTVPEKVIEIPLAKPFGFVFESTDFAVLSADPINIPYTLNGKTDKTTVGVFTNANYTAEIDAEKVVVTPPAAGAKGEVLVWAANHEGQSDIAKLTFGPVQSEKTDPTPEDPEGKYEDDVDYIAEAVGGAVEAHVTANVDIAVKSDAEWITVGEITKAAYTISLTLEDNPKAVIRYGNVKVVLSSDENVVLQTFKIAQAAGEPVPTGFDPTNFAALDWSNKEAAAWYKFAENYPLPDGFTYIIHIYPYTLNTSGMRVGNFGKNTESPCNMLRFGQNGDNAELEWMVDHGTGRSQKELLAPGFVTEKWQAVVLSADKATGEYKIYRNDELKATKTFTYNDNMGFGGIEFANSWSSAWRSAFNGRIALISIYDKALSADEVKANIFNVPVSENCVGFWSMTEGEGGLLKADQTRAIKEDIDLTKMTRSADESDHYEVVDVTGKLTWTTGNKIDTPEPPQPSSAKAANTNTNKVWFDTNITGEYSALTFETILRGDDFNGQDANINTIFGKEGEWLLRAGDSGIGKNQLQLAKKDGNWSTKFYFEEGKWYHIAVTYDTEANKCVLYVNGVEYESEEGKASLAVNFDKDNNGYGCFVSRSYGMNRWWRGAYTEMRLWNKIRTAEEIKANMLPGSIQEGTEGLLGYWKFNEGEGNTVKDYSGNNKDLTAENGDIVWEDADFKLKEPVVALTDAEWTIETDEEGSVTFKTCDAALFKAVVVKGVKKESLTPSNLASYVKDAEVLTKTPVVVSYESISSGDNCAIIAEVDADGDITGKYSALDFKEPEHLALKSDWEIIFNGYDVNKSANSFTINSCSSDYYYALVTDESDPMKALEVVKEKVNGMYYWNASASSGLPATNSIGAEDPEEGYIYVFGLNRNSWNVAVNLDYNVIQYKKENILSVPEVIAAEDNATVKFAGYVAAVSSDSAIITDNKNNNIYVFKPATVPAVGDMVFVNGKKVTYTAKNCTIALVEVAQGATVEVKSSGNEIKYPSSKNITETIDEYAGLENKSSELISIKGTLSVGNYTNLVVDGATRQGSPKLTESLSAYNGKTAKMTGYFIGTSGNPDKYINFVVVDYTILEPGNSVPQMANRYLTVDWGTQNVTALDKVTVEWEMNADAWNTTYQYSNYWGTQTGHSDVNTVFGVEGKWLLRIGDAGIANNNLELADHNHPRANVDFKTGTWYHCAVTYNTEDQTTKFYVNGKLVNSCEGTATEAADLTGALIGCSYKDNGVNSRYFNGRLANFRVWNTVRSEKEINEGIKNFTDVANANLLMYFKLDECSDNLVNSATGSDVKLTPDQELEWKQGRPDEEVVPVN